MVSLGVKVGPTMSSQPAATRRAWIAFIVIGTDIERQFEFMQQTWMSNQKFGALFNSTDPLSATIDPEGHFTSSGRRCVRLASSPVTGPTAAHTSPASRQVLQFLAGARTARARPHRFDNVSIVGVAHVDPPHRISSREIEDSLADTYSRLGMPRGLLEGLTGVNARRFWDPGTKPSDAAAIAGRKVIDECGVDAARIGILINTSVSRDYVEPSVACAVHSRLGLSEVCLNYDVTNACLGFLDGMCVAGNMLDRAQCDYALVVDAESSRHVVERTMERMRGADCDQQMMREQLATLTVGSAAVAMLLARTDLAPEGHRLLAAVSRADSRHHQLCRGQVDVGITDTANLLLHGVALAARTWQQAQDEFGWTSESVDQFAIHQVSELHSQEVARALRFSLDKTLLIYPEFGNVGPASIPMVLSKAIQAERIGRGDRVVLGGIGSGLNCTAAGVVW